MKTQKDKIKWHLLHFRKITSWEAIRTYNITRLGAIIPQLRQEGFNIESVLKPTACGKSHYAEYVLKNAEF